MISKASNFGRKSLEGMIKAKTQDTEQQVRVMRRVKLMLDPNGTAKGRDLPPEALDNMTEDEKMQYESEQLMRGMGNKCVRKVLESMLFSAIIMGVAYQTGYLNEFMFRMNPQLFEAPTGEGTPRVYQGEADL